MEVLSQVQSVVVEHAFMIGVGLLVAVVIAAVAWYSMSCPSSNSLQKGSVLENQARVNSAELDVPASAQAPEPHSQAVEQEDAAEE